MILLSQSFNAIFKKYHPSKIVVAIEAAGNHSLGNILYNSTVWSVILLLFNSLVNKKLILRTLQFRNKLAKVLSNQFALAPLQVFQFFSQAHW